MHKSNRRKNIRTKFKSKLKARVALFAGILALSLLAFIAAMPKSIVTEDYGSRNVGENVDYLNRLIRDSNFLPTILKENPGNAEQEIREQLALAPIRTEVEQVLFSRHSLSLLYPDKCPDVNLTAITLSVVLPWLDVKIADLPENDTEIMNDLDKSQRDDWNAQTVPA